MDNSKKTTTAGAIAGTLIAIGQPIISMFSQTPTEALQNFSFRDLVVGIAVGFLGWFSQGTKKGQ